MSQHIINETEDNRQSTTGARIETVMTDLDDKVRAPELIEHSND